jgi:hypothetical protein
LLGERFSRLKSGAIFPLSTLLTHPKNSMDIMGNFKYTLIIRYIKSRLFLFFKIFLLSSIQVKRKTTTARLICGDSALRNIKLSKHTRLKMDDLILNVDGKYGKVFEEDENV